MLDGLLLTMNRTASRTKVIGRIADQLVARDPGHPSRVAVDGISAAGKTTLAGEIAVAVQARGRPVVRLSMDDFHHPRTRRHRQGRTSARGYYEDAFDFDALRRFVLAPLGPGGSRQYLSRVHDLATDQPTDDSPQPAPDHAVIVVDGSFLQNQQLAGHWDDVVYVDTSFATARDRGIRRDAAMFGGVERAGDLYDAATTPPPASTSTRFTRPSAPAFTWATTTWTPPSCSTSAARSMPPCRCSHTAPCS